MSARQPTSRCHWLSAQARAHPLRQHVLTTHITHTLLLQPCTADSFHFNTHSHYYLDPSAYTHSASRLFSPLHTHSTFGRNCPLHLRLSSLPISTPCLSSGSVSASWHSSSQPTHRLLSFPSLQHQHVFCHISATKESEVLTNPGQHQHQIVPGAAQSDQLTYTRAPPASASYARRTATLSSHTRAAASPPPSPPRSLSQRTVVLHRSHESNGRTALRSQAVAHRVPQRAGSTDPLASAVTDAIAAQAGCMCEAEYLIVPPLRSQRSQGQPDTALTQGGQASYSNHSTPSQPSSGRRHPLRHYQRRR